MAEPLDQEEQRSNVNTNIVSSIPRDPMPSDGNVEADADDSSAHPSSYDTYDRKSLTSSTASISSALYRGYIENGRLYQSLNPDQYFGVSDSLQFASMEAGHLVYTILDSQCSNILFRSPVNNPKQILDIGTGDGTWAMDVADRFPDAEVRGVDLFPPPTSWQPRNCWLEVDDVGREWAFGSLPSLSGSEGEMSKEIFDLIHIRHLHAAFTLEGWDLLYKRAYEHTVPGGYIEHVELDIAVYCDDSTLPESALLRQWGPLFKSCAAKSGRPIDNELTMRSRIAAAGFEIVGEKEYKLPIGPWPKHPVFKDAGRVNHAQWKAGVEGWAMWLLTKWGEPRPWSREEVRGFVEGVGRELDRGWHVYQRSRRVWARKPLRGEMGEGKEEMGEVTPKQRTQERGEEGGGRKDGAGDGKGEEDRDFVHPPKRLKSC